MDGSGIAASIEPRASQTTLRARPRALSRLSVARPELLGLLALAAVLNLWSLRTNGWANDYYAAAVRSMSTSWHAFLYGSFDVSGVQTVDKPPLALWVQALSARVFGFHSLSLLVPQALMGMGSVALAYDLTRRRFGRAAGFAAGLVLALTPISVAISRHNNPDALLVLCATAALWFVVRGLEDGRTRWLVWSGVMVGLAFETKMAAALLVVPGLVAAWLWVAPRGRLAAVRQLAAGGVAMVVVGGAWPLLMALTPAADRPYVAGTSDNSIWSLITGYNGLGRVDGQAGGPQAFGGGGGGAGSMFGGPTGPLRLVEASLGAQAGWLVGFAIVAGAGIAVLSRLRRGDARTGWILAVGGAFAVTAVTFSYAGGIFHPYYVSLLAPFTAALVGGGVGEILRRGAGGRVLAPLAIAGGVLTEILVIRNTAGAPSWAAPLAVGAGIAMGVALAGPVPAPPARPRAIALAVVMAALIAAPASWAAQTLGHATNGTFPEGGPATTGLFGGPPGGGFGGGPPGGGVGGGGFGGRGSDVTAAVAYADAHGGGTIAVSSQTGASSAIIASGANVAGIGGFSGRESEVGAKWLAQAVADGRIRWVLTTSSGPGGFTQDGRVGATTAMSAAAKACTSVSGVSGLYDCSGKAAALAAAA